MPNALAIMMIQQRDDLVEQHALDSRELRE